MVKYMNSSCIQSTAIIALVCFLSGFLVQIAFHLVPQQHETAGLRGGPQYLIDGKPVQLSDEDLKFLAEYKSRKGSHPLKKDSNSGISTDNSELSTAGTALNIEDETALPNIVRAWRAAKVDWHSLVPAHNSLWERFGTPKSEGKLRALVAKETLITDYLTRYQESGLAGMYGHEHGPLTAYSGCNAFASSCMIHDEQHCHADELCGWVDSLHLCVDIWDPRVSIPPQNEQMQCTKPKIMGENGFVNAPRPEQCQVWVQQPAVVIDIDSESQSMFYHWWATWSGIVAYWKGRLKANRGVHFFPWTINDPMFFQFFGLLSDNCWRRVGPKYSPPSVCYCNVENHGTSQSREAANDAAAQMLQYLQLADVKPPEKRVKVGLISRRRKRFILNEYALVERVKKMGYDCVLLPLESMTLYEQMRELRSLDVLVGIHGSALDNAVFLHPGSVLVQLLPYKVEHRVTFRATAVAAGVRYQEWQLQDPNLAVFHWDLLEQANAEVLRHISKEEYMSRGQKAADNRETLMFWINQDIVVPLAEWQNVIRAAVQESPAAKRNVIYIK